jgi:hypothetical protein
MHEDISMICVMLYTLPNMRLKNIIYYKFTPLLTDQRERGSITTRAGQSMNITPKSSTNPSTTFVARGGGR